MGLKGELNIAPLTEDPDRFEKLKSVWIGAEETGAEKHAVQSARVGRSGVVVKLKDIETRSEADARRGNLVFVAERDSVTPRKGSYFIHDVIGMKVLTDEGVEVGVVKEIMQLPANDVWVVAAASREILLPAIKDVIRSVDLEHRVVTIHPLEGLLE